MIHLQKYYFISDFNKSELIGLNKKVNIIYRNYKDPIKELIIKKIRKECKKIGNKFFLSNNFHLAIKLKLDGVYIPSFNKSLNLRYKTKNNFQILGSAHNINEIRIKEKQGVNLLFLSPTFKVKKTKNFLGIVKFNLLSMLTKKKVIALGGINKNNIKNVKLLRCHGYSGITYFKNKENL